MKQINLYCVTLCRVPFGSGIPEKIACVKSVSTRRARMEVAKYLYGDDYRVIMIRLTATKID